MRTTITGMSDTTPSAPRKGSATVTLHTSTLVAGAGILVALVAAAVALALAHWDTGAIVGLLTAIIGVGAVALGQLDHLARVRDEQREQSATLATIDRRTNGELDARIAAAVASALGTNKITPAAAAAGEPTLSSGQSTPDSGTERLAA